jgi:hypothetical protein
MTPAEGSRGDPRRGPSTGAMVDAHRNVSSHRVGQVERWRPGSRPCAGGRGSPSRERLLRRTYHDVLAACARLALTANLDGEPVTAGRQVLRSGHAAHGARIGWLVGNDHTRLDRDAAHAPAPNPAGTTRKTDAPTPISDLTGPAPSWMHTIHTAGARPMTGGVGSARALTYPPERYLRVAADRPARLRGAGCPDRLIPHQDIRRGRCLTTSNTADTHAA